MISIKKVLVPSLILTLSGCQTVSHTVGDAVGYGMLYGVILPVGAVTLVGEKTATPLVVDPLKKWSAESEIEGMEASGIIPEIDRSSDRAGTDKDQNGIRDDVDHFIEAKADVPETALVLKQIARGFQEVQVADEASVDLYLSYKQKTKSGLDCLRYHEYLKNGEDAERTLYAIDNLTANTAKRKEWKAKVDELEPSNDLNGYGCNIMAFQDYVFRGKRLADQK